CSLHHLLLSPFKNIRLISCPIQGSLDMTVSDLMLQYVINNAISANNRTATVFDCISLFLLSQNTIGLYLHLVDCREFRPTSFYYTQVVKMTRKRRVRWVTRERHGTCTGCQLN